MQCVYIYMYLYIYDTWICRGRTCSKCLVPKSGIWGNSACLHAMICAYVDEHQHVSVNYTKGIIYINLPQNGEHIFLVVSNPLKNISQLG